MDDVAPLQGLTRETVGKPLHLFAQRPAFGRYLAPAWEGAAGAGHFRGANPPEGIEQFCHASGDLRSPGG